MIAVSLLEVKTVREGKSVPPQVRSIVVEVAKLRDYCLSAEHPRGRYKARVFRSRLGIAATDAELLRRALLDAAWNRQAELQSAGTDLHGQRYVLNFPMVTAVGTATIRSTWIVPTDQDVLRFVTCYVL